MQFISIIGLLGTVSASAVQMSGQIVSGNVLGGLVERQLRFCNRVPVGPNLCARSCGAGYVSCIVDTMCYNPSLGQVCCSNSRYCDAGYYCSDAGCCPNELSLEECGATVTLSIIPPPSEPTSAPEPSTSDEPAPEPEPTTTEEPTDIPEPTTSEEPTDVPEPTTSEEPTSSVPTETPEPTESESTTTDLITTISSLPTSTPAPTAPTPTAAAAMNVAGAGMAVVGGLVANLLLL
ncbi:hypothetical protein HJFPF1_13339 [Paramyrothecium foliicola]|nr:hypothetical protein HJFPF1_13339 [Paramyrothecium foliicola]